MYRKEECLSLLKDPDQPEADEVNLDSSEKTPKLKWHKVGINTKLVATILKWV